MQACGGSAWGAAPRTGGDGDALRKISVFHQENCSFVCDIPVEHPKMETRWGTAGVSRSGGGDCWRLEPS